MTKPLTITRTAVISPCERYRYSLSRSWDGIKGRVCWILLNPSTADANIDDPTIRRIVSFSDSWGFGSVVVVNLFALRSTDPRALLTSSIDPIGPDNDAAIREAVLNSELTVMAWGSNKAALGRDHAVCSVVAGTHRAACHLGSATAGGHPRHPLYLKSDTERMGSQRAFSRGKIYLSAWPVLSMGYAQIGGFDIEHRDYGNVGFLQCSASMNSAIITERRRTEFDFPYYLRKKFDTVAEAVDAIYGYFPPMSIKTRKAIRYDPQTGAEITKP